MKYSSQIITLGNYSKTKKIGNFVRYKPELIQKLISETNFLPITATNMQRLWHVNNNSFEAVCCLTCSSFAYWRSNGNIYSNYCVICSKQSIECLTKRKRTNKERYGVINTFNIEQSKQTKLGRYSNAYWSNPEKMKETWNRKPNCELDSISSRRKLTKLAKYGNEYYNNIDKIIETHQVKYGGILNGSQELKDKAYNTKLSKYGDGDYNNRSLSISTIRKNYHERFLKICNELYTNKYEYGDLGSSHDYIDIICPVHGLYKQQMYVHMAGHQCPNCMHSPYSKMAIEWLEYVSKEQSIYIQHAMNEGEYRIPKTRWYVDGYCKETNTVYEFLGDYWHGNPEMFIVEDINPTISKSYGELYDTTMERLIKIEELGCNVVYIWEKDWKDIR